jgi:hypothetical protein
LSDATDDEVGGEVDGKIDSKIDSGVEDGANDADDDLSDKNDGGNDDSGAGLALRRHEVGRRLAAVAKEKLLALLLEQLSR